MTLGETIRTVRSEKGMSQGDLADALDVSRQSVSKWETDASVPELDKLVKMCDLFGVSLDELVRGVKTEETLESAEQPEPQQEPPVSPEWTEPEVNRTEAGKPKISTRQHITGIILLCTSAVILLMLTAMGSFFGGIVFGSPFLVCGIICVTQQKYVPLKCSWSIYFLVDAYLSYATGVSRGWVISCIRSAFYGTLSDLIRFTNPITALLSIVMLLAALGLMAWTVIVIHRNITKLRTSLLIHSILFFGSWIGNHFAAKLLMHGSLNFNELNITLGRFSTFIFGWVQIISVSGLLCVLFAWLYHRKHK